MDPTHRPPTPATSWSRSAPTSSSGVRAALALVAYLLVAGALTTVGPYAEVSRLGGRLAQPEERPGISPAAVSIFLGRIGVSGRVVYGRALALDIAMPLLFAFAGWAIVEWSRARTRNWRVAQSLILRLLMLVVAAEVIENVLLLGALRNYPGRPPLGQLIGVVVGVKLTAYAISAVSLVALGVATVMNASRPARRVH